MRRIGSGLGICLIVLLISSVVVASNLADSVFNSATVSLLANKTAQFSADTLDVVPSIEISRVKLYKMVGTTWVYIADLPVPSYQATNTLYYYYAPMDYSAYIGTGKYRLKVTFTADNHNMTRYSNDRTY